jgi:hypothetical protein
MSAISSRFAARRADEIGVVTALSIQGERAAEAKGFIVGMSQNCK